MEVIDNKTEGVQAEDNNKKEPQGKGKTHEQQLIEFNAELNTILAKGYSIPAVLTVLEGAIFELRMATYMMQMQMEEQRRQQEKRIEIPHMKIPTNKK